VIKYNYNIKFFKNENFLPIAIKVKAWKYRYQEGVVILLVYTVKYEFFMIEISVIVNIKYSTWGVLSQD